jgi:hypothetical protein
MAMMAVGIAGPDKVRIPRTDHAFAFRWEGTIPIYPVVVIVAPRTILAIIIVKLVTMPTTHVLGVVVVMIPAQASAWGMATPSPTLNTKASEKIFFYLSSRL